ncbi:MAG: HAD family hydrolase [Clostridiales bacterium]|nr:HAD family hydrolase [Clostridiales bacterium]
MSLYALHNILKGHNMEEKEKKDVATEDTKSVAPNEKREETSVEEKTEKTTKNSASKKSSAKTTKKSSSSKTSKSKTDKKPEAKEKVEGKTEAEVKVEKEPKETEQKDKNIIKAPRIISPDEAEKSKWPFAKKKKVENVEVERFHPSAKEGLTSAQVEKRIEAGKINFVDTKNTKTYKSIVLGNIFTFFNILCMLVAVALISVGAWGDCFFMIIVLANTAIGIVQEIKAKKTIEKISLVSSPTAIVIRDKFEAKIPVSEVVLDDIIMFQTGKQICADCIVVDGSVEVNESLLTGESVSIKKNKGDILYSGSFVVGGKCYARVDKVGNDTYTSKLAMQAKQYKKPKSELMGTLNLIIKIIGVIIIPLAYLSFRSNYIGSGDMVDTIRRTAVSAIGMIPSGMFLLTSMALAVGVIKLIKRRTLVQDLYSIEMLARTDVLCLDKTGTITDGTMKVNNVIQLKLDFKYTMEQLVGSMLTALDDNNQTSRALITHFGYSKELVAQTILPFNSTRKLSGVTFTTGESFVFGAPEYVLKTKNKEIEGLVKTYTTKGFRVLLLAQCNGAIKDDKIPQERTPVAVIVIEDHIREDAAETIKWFRENNVEIKIISGDNPITVSEVSKRVGVENADKYISLEGLTQQQVIDAVDKYTVFGRVSPEQKCILVKALKTKGHKVAMTGDGVNDILALKEADCSIAMASGSEATRLVSNLVLLDSNFSSMPSVVAEGRRVINNIQKSSSLFLMKTIFTILLTIFCLILDEPYLFENTKQVLMLEVLVIGIPSFFLALQPNNEKISGKFIVNLLSKSIPGALILFINVVACYIFNTTLGTVTQTTTMASLAITFIGLLVLFRLCKPFDIFRGCLFAAMVTICVLILALGNWELLFEYVSLHLQDSLFIVCLVLASYPTYDVIIKGLDKLIALSRKE